MRWALDNDALDALVDGVTSIVLDPHEFANVMGVAGIRYVLESSRGLPLSAYVMISSCVPASSFESPYRVLKAEDLLPLLEDKQVLGLAEMTPGEEK